MGLALLVSIRVGHGGETPIRKIQGVRHRERCALVLLVNLSLVGMASITIRRFEAFCHIW